MSEKEQGSIHSAAIINAEIVRTVEGDKLNMVIAGCEKGLRMLKQDIETAVGRPVKGKEDLTSRSTEKSKSSFSFSGDWSGSDWQPQSPFFKKLAGNPRDN